MRVTLYDRKGSALLRHELESELLDPPEDAVLVGTAELNGEDLEILLSRLQARLIQ
jgi:hypothetical protein